MIPNRLTAWMWMFSLLFAPLFAEAQYTTNYSASITDITSYATTGTNAWKYLPGTPVCKPDTLAVGSDVWVFCIGAGDGYPYKFYNSTKTWVKQSTMGTAAQSLAVQNNNTVYSLQHTSHCDSFGANGLLGVFIWNGTGWNQPSPNTCAFQLSVGGDNFLTAIGRGNNNSDKVLAYSKDSGATWTYWADGWTFVDMYSSDLGCAINSSGGIYKVGDGQNSISMPTMPGSARGCLVVSNESAFLAWNTAGAVYLLDLNTVTWKPVAGLTANQLAGVTKATVFGLDTLGKPYHWNVFPLQIMGTLSGTYDNFPMNTGDNPQHTGTIQVSFPHGLAGIKHSQQIPYNGQMNVSSLDFSPQCDTMFGPTGDPECTPSTSGDEVCSQAGNIGQPSDANITEGMATDNVEWTGNAGFSAAEQVGTPEIGFWTGTVRSYVSDACYASGGLPTCLTDSPISSIAVREYDDLVDGYEAEAEVQAWMTADIQGLHSPWSIDYYWVSINNQPATCFELNPHAPKAYNGHFEYLPKCK